MQQQKQYVEQVNLITSLDVEASLWGLHLKKSWNGKITLYFKANKNQGFVYHETNISWE